MNRILKTLALGAVALVPHIAAARDAALIVVETDYSQLPDAPGMPQLTGLAAALEAAGFQVTTSQNASADDTWEAVAAFRDAATLADRVFILLAGHIVHTSRDTWLLTRFSDRPTDLTVGGGGLLLGPLLDTAAEHPGQAVVMLAPSGADLAATGILNGAAADAPQGVTVLTGPVDRLVRVAVDVLLEPGMPPREALVPPPRGVEVSGFLSDALPFVTAPDSAGPVPPPPPREPDPEVAYWNVVRSLGTPEAYRAYLDTYPAGQVRAIAQAAIQGAVVDADARARAEEDALGLDQTARRDVQRNLSLLGFDPKGVDGIFGPGSRTAIKAWQQARGYSPTGFLTAPQLSAMSVAAEQRAAQIAAEAAQRKAEEEQRDTAYWRDTGRGGTEAGLRAYLARYPDGLYATFAEERLAEIEAAKRAQAQAAEREVWDGVRATDTVAAYNGYLQKYPSGLFAEEAKARIAEIEAETNTASEQAAANEEAIIANNGVMRLLVETKLAAAGYDPGKVDGKFNNATRRAIKQFQRDQGIAVTGYVGQETMVRLLAVK